MINVNGTVLRGQCSGSADQHLATLGEWAKAAGMGVGVVTTARVTHATPAGVYAHSVDREFESDNLMPPDVKADGCKDIATQLLEWNVTGEWLDVVFGGGRDFFLPVSAGGKRTDGQNLVQQVPGQSIYQI